MVDNRRKPYKGKARRLVIAIDIGTTFTAASFCILQPGNIPKFEEVLRWPKQATPDAKIPSIVYYDKINKPRAFAAETEDEDVIIEAEEYEWHKMEWWKLHLRPNHLPLIRDLELPPLPTGITVDDIFAHFLGYVKTQLQEYIVSTYADGGNIWNTLSPSMYVILTTPNGWEGRQQQRMRAAAVKGGLVDKGNERQVKFVSEAEAAVLYAVDSGSVGDWLVADGSLILCDCGGGTIDITGYKINKVSPLRLEESSASRCYLAGAVFVTHSAKEYLKNRLAGTEWDTEESMQRILSQFDKNAKRKFDDPSKPSYVQLDGFKNDPKLGIIRGKLKIPGTDMASFFAPSLNTIKQGLEIAFENGDRRADKIILVGGLASSPYVYAELVKWGEEFGVPVSRPDGPTTKAVANGALAWHLDSSVGSRIAKYHYGTEIGLPFDKDDPEMAQRDKVQFFNGQWRVSGAWSEIVKKNTKLEAEKEFINAYNIEIAEGQFADNKDIIESVDIFAYRRSVAPKFIRFPRKRTYQPGFDLICTVVANLSDCYEQTAYKMGPLGRYKTLNFDICIALGETEVSARMRWMYNGEYKYGNATVVCD